MCTQVIDIVDQVTEEILYDAQKLKPMKNKNFS